MIQCISICFGGSMILNITYANTKSFSFFNFNTYSLYTTLKARPWQSPLYQQPHLHVTSGDEALVLDVTHLEELVGFLQDSVVSHVPTLTCTRLFVAPLPVPCSLGHRAAHGIAGGKGSSKSRHGFCESVAIRAFPASFT